MKRILTLVLCAVLCLGIISFGGTVATAEYTVGDLVRVSDYTEIRILGVRYRTYYWTEPGRIWADVSAEVFTTAIPEFDIRWSNNLFFRFATTDTGNRFSSGGSEPLYPNQLTYVIRSYSIPQDMILTEIELFCPGTSNIVNVTIPPPDQMPVIPVTTTSTAQIVNGNIVLDVTTSVHITSQALHAAIFDSSDILLEHIVIPVTRPIRNFYVVFDALPGASYAKVFIWDSFETMKPIADAENVPIQPDNTQTV